MVLQFMPLLVKSNGPIDPFRTYECHPGEEPPEDNRVNDGESARDRGKSLKGRQQDLDHSCVMRVGYGMSLIFERMS